MTALDLAPAALAALTMPQVLKRRADAHPEQLALRDKDRGIWHETSWRQYFDNARRCAIGLYVLGFRAGDRLAVASENTPEWFYADMAAQMLGGACLGVYPTNPWPELQYIVRHSRAKLVICGDQEQTDKVIDAQRFENGLPDLTRIVCVDMKGMRHYRQNNLMSFAALLELGEKHEADFGTLVDQALAAGKPDDVAVIVYTSGTTGMPKGAMLSHRNMLYPASRVVETASLDANTYSVVCYLPLCHVAERSFSTLMHLLTGCVVSFAESVDTVVTNLREIAPLGFLGVPRIWEKMQQSVQYRIKDARPLQRRVFETCMRLGAPIAERRLRNGGTLASLGDRLAFFLLWLACYRSLQSFLGLNRVRNGFCGGATVSPSVLMFFWILGVPVYQIYGMTEAGGVTHMQQPGYTLSGSSGLLIDGLTQKLADDGELLLRGTSVFAGYLYDDVATARALQDGWLHTGDIVRFEPNGEVTVYDRKKDIIITSGGKNITPSLIENALKDSLYIREAILLGDGRKFLAALIQIDYDTVGQWAQQQRLPYTTYRNLAEHREVFDLVQIEVDKVNARFARVENIRKFVILSKELDHDDGELTATMKIRRKVIDEKFSAEIKAIYGERGLMEFFGLLVASGLVSGAAYGMIAMGFAVIYKATGVVNFAQGELAMLTAYIAFSIASTLQLPFLALMTVTIPIAMLIGLLLERIFIRPMLGEPQFAIVMVTIGLAVILRGATIMIWGPDPFDFPIGLPREAVKIGPLPFYPAQLAAIAALGVLVAAAYAFLRFSRYGIAMRAVAANEKAAMLMGIAVSRIHSLAWVLSSAIAAVAGVLFAANFKLGPDLWFQGLKSFPAVILGGLDSIVGAAIGGLVIGVIENLAQGYLGQGLREIAGFAVIVIVLMVRPYGLFGEREIERV